MSVDKLEFELKIDDKKFDKQVKDALDKAKDLNVELSKLLNFKANIKVFSDAESKNAKDIVSSYKSQAQWEKQMAQYQKKRLAYERQITQQLQQQQQAQNQQQNGSGNGGNNGGSNSNNQLNTQKSVNKELEQSKVLWKEISKLALTYFSIDGARAFVSNLVRITGEFELQKITLGAILRDVDKANILYGQIKNLAIVSPFTFKELATYAKQLSAFSVPVSELYDTTKMLADVSAGLGVGMDRLILAYGQIRSASFLRGQEVRQLTEAGVPILDELAKQFKEITGEMVSAGQVFDKISAREVPFEMVKKVFEDMTSEGGKFYNMQEVQIDTIYGKCQKIKDAFTIAMSEIGDNNRGLIAGSLDWVYNLVKNFDLLAKIIVDAAAAFGTYYAVLGLTLAAQKAFAAFNFITHLGAITRRVQILNADATKLGVVMGKLGVTSKMAFAGLAAAATVIGIAIAQAVNKANELDNALNSIVAEKISDADKLVSDFDRLKEKLEGAAVGSKNYRDAISEINRKYGEYLPNLLTEKNALDELTASYNIVTNAIHNKAKAMAKERGEQKITDEMNDKYAKNLTAALTVIQNLSGKSKESAINFVKKFKEDLLHAAENEDVMSVFRQSFLNFYGSMPKLEAGDYGTASTIRSIGNAFRGENEKIKEFNQQLDVQFDKATYTSEEEYVAVKKVTDQYEEQKRKLNEAVISAKEYNKQLKALDVERLTNLIGVYKGLGRQDLVNQYTTELKALQNVSDGWRKLVNDVLASKYEVDSKGAGVGAFYASDTDSYLEYIDELRKVYSKLGQEIKDTAKANPKLNAELKKQKEAIEAIGKALGISVDDKVKKTKGSGGKTAEQIELETRINTVKKLYDAYKKLKELGLDDSVIRTYLDAYFPGNEDVTRFMNFEAVINNYADALEKYDKKAAQSLRELVSKSGIDALIDRIKAEQKAAESLDDTLRGLTEDSVDGEGVSFKVSTIVKNYKKKLMDVAEKVKKAKEEAKEAGLDMNLIGTFIDMRGNTADQNAANKATEDVRKLAEEWVKDWAAMKGVNLEGWSQMTRNELKTVQEALEGFFDEDGNVILENLPEDIEKKLQGIPGAFEAFVKALKEVIGDDGKDGGGLLGKLFNDLSDEKAKELKYYAEQLLQLSDAVKEFASEAGLTGLATTMAAISATADTFKAIEEGFEKGGVLGAVVAFVANIATGAFQAATEMQKLKNAIIDAAEEARRLNAENALESGVDTLWGENTVRKIKNAVSAIKEMQKVTESDRYVHWEGGWGGLGAGRGKVGELIEKLGYEMYDAYGNLNSEGLQAILDTYDKLSVKDRQWIQEAIDNAEIYAEAMEQLEDVISDVFSSVSDDIATKLIDAWKEAGDAGYELAENLDEVFTDLADDIAQKLVSSFIIDKVMNNLESDVIDLFKLMENPEGNEDVIAAEFSRLANTIIEESQAAADFTNALYGALGQYLDFADTEESDTLANGIKSITEDTANLLASYLNAIRADVSSNRVTTEGIGNDVKAILGLLPSTPTLAEYLTKIEANTFNNAEYTRTLMENIASVTTSEPGATSIRVYSM